jgi:hypothetical protein
MLAGDPALAQTGFDRPGGDYARIAAPSGDPALCALQCERDRRCRAWAFNYPADAPGSAVCWLKGNVPARTQSAGRVTGVRGAGVVEQRNSEVEMSTDRQGGDYRSFDVAAEAGAEACRAACDDDQKCRAWTFVRPGYLGAGARCFLKSQIKPPRRKPGMISGVTR